MTSFGRRRLSMPGRRSSQPRGHPQVGAVGAYLIEPAGREHELYLPEQGCGPVHAQELITRQHDARRLQAAEPGDDFGAFGFGTAPVSGRQQLDPVLAPVGQYRRASPGWRGVSRTTAAEQHVQVLSRIAQGRRRRWWEVRPLLHLGQVLLDTADDLRLLFDQVDVRGRARVRVRSALVVPGHQVDQKSAYRPNRFADIVEHQSRHRALSRTNPAPLR